MIGKGENLGTQKKTHPSTTLTTTNSKWTALESQVHKESRVGGQLTNGYKSKTITC
jgi:hypothetical protein